MRWKIPISVTLALILVPGILLSQHGRGGSGGGRSTMQTGPAAGMGQGTGMHTGSMDRDRTQDRTQLHDRLHSQATAQQRDQFRDCAQTMDRTRQQARTMSRATKGSSFDSAAVRQQQQQFQEQLRTMEQNRERLYQGLNNDQREAIQARHQNMLQLHERMQNRLSSMNQELSKESPDSKQLADLARANEREMNSYRKQFRSLGDELNLASD